jgi:pyruvate dehydrogenase E2 component (dihydrolipoamide acetyltransferase)
MHEVPLVMPKMSMTMQEGTLVVWHKSVDDPVRVGDVVCEVATDKVDMEVESTAEGTLTRLVAEPDQVVPVGEPIAYIASTTDDLLEGLLDTSDKAAEDTGRATVDTGVASAGMSSSRKRAVPLARRRAKELDLDLESIDGSGPGGTVRVVDVDRATHDSRPAVPSRTVRALAPQAAAKRQSTRHAVARRMTASTAVPQFVVYRDLDLETLTVHRGKRSWTTLLMQAFAGVLRNDSTINAMWTDEGCQRLDHVAVSVAVDTDRGLLAPVVRDPDLVPTGELDERLRDLVRRAREGKLAVDELSSATTTVSNLGAFGIDAFHALLTPPQATALALGRIGPRAVPVVGGIAVRTSCTVGLTVDHRVADGANAARALQALQDVLNDPLRFVTAQPKEA